MPNRQTGVWIRFKGSRLASEAVPIQDLSFAMLAVQRLIYKAHLFREERLSRFAAPSDRERDDLALRLDERRRSSDAYLLLAGPVFTDIVAPLIVQGVSALAAYAWAATKWRPKQKPNAGGPKVPAEISENPLTVYIFPQVESLARRVGAAGQGGELSIRAELRAVAADLGHMVDDLERMTEELRRSDDPEEAKLADLVSGWLGRLARVMLDMHRHLGP